MTRTERVRVTPPGEIADPIRYALTMLQGERERLERDHFSRATSDAPEPSTCPGCAELHTVEEAIALLRELGERRRRSRA